MRYFLVATAFVTAAHIVSPAYADPFGAAVGPCVGDFRSSSPYYTDPIAPGADFEPFVSLNFAITLPSGWTTQDYYDAVAETEDMEVCIVSGQTGVASCPWSAYSDGAWWFNPAQESNIEPASSAPEAKRWIDVPVDWRQSGARFLVIRRKVAGAWQTWQDAAQQFGFCLVPQPLTTSAGGEFSMIGVDTTIAFPELSDPPPSGLDVDPCVAGNRTANRAAPGAFTNACVHADLPDYAAKHYISAWDWQDNRFWGTAVSPVWDWSASSTECGLASGDCPTFVFFHEDKRGAGGGGMLTNLGRILMTVSGPMFHFAFNDPSPTVRQETSWVLGIDHHEFFHSVQAQWNVDQGFDGDVAARALPILEQPVANVGYDSCTFDYDGVSNAAVCASPSRIGHHEPRYNNFYFHRPNRRLFSDATQAVFNSDQFWLYVREQFATADSSINLAHPAAVAALWPSQLATPVGDENRTPDEGADILHRIWSEFTIPSSNPSWATSFYVIDKALKRNIGRGLDSLVLDYHTALML